jgi:hypothetical protein
MRFPQLVCLAALTLFAGSTGCASDAASETPDDSDLTSTDGKVFDFAFKGEVIASKDMPVREAVLAQLQYVQGMLTTDVQGNAQVGFVKLSDVSESAVAGAGEKRRIRYAAKLPVVWPKAVASPTSYSLPLPLDLTALSSFNATYDGKCGKNEYGQYTFWHDFNPKDVNCKLEGATDVARSVATVERSPQESQGKFPEYAEMLKDDVLDVVAVFGIISSNNDQDPGAVEMDNVGYETARSLTEVTRKEQGPRGSILRSQSVTGKAIVRGRTVTVNLTSMLVNEVNGAGADFDALYGPASANADLIIYSGHSGLGKNINALADKTQVKAGKYQLMYLNGCQTFAYIGRTLHDKKTATNGAANDPEGTKYLDVIANALPAYGDVGITGLRVYRAILQQDTPQSYSDLLKRFSRAHLVAVFGEEDNTFSPR